MCDRGMYDSFTYSYKAERSRNGLSVEVRTDSSKEHVNSVLDVLLSSCLRNESFHNLLADTSDSQRYN